MPLECSRGSNTPARCELSELRNRVGTTRSASACDQGVQIKIKQIADSLDCQVGRRVSGIERGIMSKLALAREYGGDTVAPGFLNSAQDSQFVIHQYVMWRWVALFDIRQCIFLVDVNENMAAYRFADAGTLHLAQS